MKNAVLVVALIVMAVLGYWLMTKLDKLMEKNAEATSKKDSVSFEGETDSASCIMLTNELTDEQVNEEVKRFRRNHENFRIVIYDAEHSEDNED